MGSEMCIRDRINAYANDILKAVPTLKTKMKCLFYVINVLQGYLMKKKIIKKIWVSLRVKLFSVANYISVRIFLGNVKIVCLLLSYGKHSGPLKFNDINNDVMMYMTFLRRF